LSSGLWAEESARELLNKSDNERSDALSTAMSFLELYRDPALANCDISGR
jgi:type IV secretory pathway TraG/TraD family ATPase VirD4